MIPRNLVNYISNPSGVIGRGVNPLNVAIYPLFTSKTESGFYLEQPSVLAENYSPVNKKLLSYPFSYFYVTNKCGEDVTYRYEDFPRVNGVRRMTYKKAYVPSASVSAKLYFTNYKSHAEDTTYGSRLYNYGVNFGKVPVCAWTTDYYTNWLTQNGVNVAMNTASGLGSAAFGAYSGALTAVNPLVGGLAMAGGALSAASTIGSTIGEMHKASELPWQAQGDLNMGDLMYAYTRNSISFYFMSVRPEFARIADNYFSAYGYKVNQVKLPNITGRRNWNYVKTIGCYIQADIPQEDLQTIKDMFDRGVTFWHNASTFGDYSQNNDIIS